MDEQQARDNALFEQLEKKKKSKRRRRILTVVLVIALAAVLLTVGVVTLRRRVTDRFGPSLDEVQAYTVSTGSISTTISASGTLTDVDLEEVTVPAGVEVTEILIEAHQELRQGDTLATVDMASVMNAMASLQEELDALDEELSDAAGDTVSAGISAGVRGRVKKLYAQAGDDVISCMAQHGALALLSLDGTMAVAIETDALAAGDSVTVLRADGSQIAGVVDAVAGGQATVLVSDNGPEVEEAVTVLSEDGKTLGSGTLEVHSPLRVTGVAGTVSAVSARENQAVYASTRLFTLTDRAYSANYELLLRRRAELEDTLLELMALYRAGAVLAPFSGSVSRVDYDETAQTDSGAIPIATLSPDESMSVTISVDEADILSLAIGQTAQITIDSVGEDLFTGSVTEISRTAVGSSGVTRYSAVVTLPKDSRMLPGMTASITVRISGVDNALIIPMDALHQTSATAYVYTSYNEEAGELGGMTEVVSGISNDSFVEIISGLKEGDTVYYTPASNIFFSFNRRSMTGGQEFTVSMEAMPEGGGNFGGNFGGGNFGERSNGGNFGGGMPNGGSGGSNRGNRG